MNIPIDIQLLQAVVSNDEKRILELLATGADINHRFRVGESVLWYALHNDHINLIKLLVDHGAIIDNNILHEAISRGCLKMVRALIECGAEIDDQAFTTAVYSVNLEIINLLIINGANTDYVNEYGKNVLCAVLSFWYTFSDAKLNTIKLLLDSGIDVNDRRSAFGNTALHCAASCEIEYIKLLLDYGADINATNTKGKTPLEYAFDQPIRELLISRGAVTYKSNEMVTMIIRNIQDRFARNIDFNRIVIERLVLLRRC